MSELIADGACHTSGGLTRVFHGRAAVERGIFRPTYVVIVGLFDGMGILRMSAERLGLSIAGYVSCEIDPTAKRVIRLRWPGVVQMGDIRSVMKASVEAVFKTFAGMDFGVWLGAGSPCQSFSALSRFGQGLDGKKSLLLLEVPRVLHLISDVVKRPICWFVENVASMSLKSLRECSLILGCKPYRSCVSDVVHMRRPRLIWLSHTLVESEKWESVKARISSVAFHT